MTQREQIKKLYDLCREHPDCEVFVATDTEHLDDNFGWMRHEINRVEFGAYWFDGGERILTDAEDVMDQINDYKEKEITEEEAAKLMTPAIIIYTGH